MKGKGCFVTSFNIIKNDDFNIQLIESFPCKSRLKLNKREGYYITALDCINKCIAGRTASEYFQEYKKNNQALIKESKKQYYEMNKQKITEQKKIYAFENYLLSCFHNFLCLHSVAVDDEPPFVFKNILNFYFVIFVI